MDRGALWATVHGVIKSWTQLSDTFTFIHKSNLSNLASSGSSKMLSGNQSIKKKETVFKFSDLVSFIPVARQQQNDILISDPIGYSLSRCFWLLHLTYS